MSAEVSKPSTPPPSPPFQFSLRTLLLLFVVLGSSLAVFGAWGIVVFAVEVVFAVQMGRAKPYGCLAFLVVGPVILFAIWPVVTAVSASRLRAHCLSDLRQIAFALQCYHQTYNGQFPPAYSVDKSGTPLLSWRVLILPLLYDETEVTLIKKSVNATTGRFQAVESVEDTAFWQCLLEFVYGRDADVRAI